MKLLVLHKKSHSGKSTIWNRRVKKAAFGSENLKFGKMIGSIQRKGREEAVNSIVTYNVEGSLPLQITKTAFL